MLYKKELSIIPLCVMRSATVQIKHSVRFFGSAQIVELKRSGIVLNVDFFDLDGNVVWRFFSDGNTHISMNLYRGSGWSRGTVNGHLGTDRWSEHYFTSPDDELLAGGFLGQLSTYSDNRIANMCDGFIYDKYSESAHRSWEKWVAPMQKHFKLFTYPKGMERYCDTYVFKKYLFYKKAGRKEYEVECSYCGHRYTSVQAPKHKHEGKCPKCRCQALYFRRQYITSIYEKDELCVARKHGNLTLISWVNLYRDFRGGSPAYQYYDRFRNVVETDEGKKTVYAYFMREGRGYYGYYNHGWFRMKNGEIGSSDAYIYKPGAKYLVPALWEGFNLVEHLRNPRQRTNLEALLYNLKQYPQTEYLLKMGLHEFVNGWGLGHFICGGKGFGGALGIRPQYLPLYKAYKPTRREHELIRKSEQWISEELFLKIRAHPEITYEKLEKALEYTSLEKLVNYLFKQYEHYAHSIKCFEFTQLLTWFRDYFDMARKVNIDLSRKSRLMPRDLKFSHDRLSVRISEARRRQKEEEDARIEALRDEERQKAEQERLEKQERNREAFQVVKERIYAKIPEYRNSEYIVVLPQCEEDFIAEGDSLGHCVGNGTYYSNHVKMNTMVFFIRRATRPDRPYITLSVNMSSCTKGELYGYGDHAVTTAVKDFVNGFLKAMKQSLKIKDPPPEKKKQVVPHREDRMVHMPRAA